MELRILDKEFELFISENDINYALDRLALEILEKIGSDKLTFICVLKGSFMFCADLMKRLPAQVCVEFVFAKSYEGLRSTGNVRLSRIHKKTLQGRHVIIVEDVVDSGLTVNALAKELDTPDVTSLSVCTLLFKPNAYRGKIKIDFVGFEIPNYFVVGYGLDYYGEGRGLRSIYKIKT